MDDQIITIVSGLPRSGTSMLMKMLDVGGIPPLTDNIRTPDDDNPKGYYEFERVKRLPEDNTWLEDAKRKAVKVLAEGVKRLPDSHTYRVLFIQRNLDEIIESQKKMLIRRGEDPDRITDNELRELLSRYLRILKQWINTQSNMEVLYLNYNNILMNPKESARKINKFLHGSLDEERMVAAVDRSLYRNRAEE